MSGKTGDRKPSYYEFFAGGGMARAGLGRGWRHLFANDVDPKKAASYAANFGARGLKLADVATLTVADAPGRADLAWASFPCQDLSLAGGGAGFGGARSSVFWPFWRLIEDLRAVGRGPRIIVLENVVGLLSSRGGRDFRAVLAALSDGGYMLGALVIDAARFTPQSRPRLFILGADSTVDSAAFTRRDAEPAWSSPPLLRAMDAARDDPRVGETVWWALAPPATRRAPRLERVLEPDAATDATWMRGDVAAAFLRRMAAAHQAKVHDAVKEARARGERVVGALYNRGRPDAEGRTRQRLEVRFDGLAGCLRTPAGGSSRQSLLEVAPDGALRRRLLTPREAARLMGLADSYTLPDRATDAYHLLGDGVVAPVVRHLARGLLRPMALSERVATRRATQPSLQQHDRDIDDDQQSHHGVEELQA